MHRKMKIMKREPKFLLISLLAVLTVTSSSALLSNYVSDVLVLLTIEPPNFNPSIGKTTTQTAYTDKDGHAIFTVQIGPRSSSGIYNIRI